MKKGYVNWTLILVLLLGMAAVGVTVFGLRKFNRTKRAEQGLQSGLQAYEEKRWRDAATGLGQYLGVHQSDIDVLLKYGEAQSRIQPFKRENYAQAINAYRLVMRTDETNEKGAIALIDLYLQAQVPGEAELIATRFLEKEFNSGIARRLATAQVMQRKFEQAAEGLLALIQRAPDEIAAYELLSLIAQERPELSEKTPRQWIDAAVQANPDKAQAYILRGSFLTRSGQREEAIQNLQQAAGCDLSDLQTHLALAAGWLRVDALEQAGKQLDAIYAAEPKSPELWQLRAVAAAKSQDPETSARIAREGLEQLGDENVLFLPYAVELFLQANELEAAQNAMDQLQKTEISRGLVCYLDGILAERKGDWPRAMAQWREAVVQGYASESVYLKLAEGAVRLEDRTTAIETLRRYVNQNPQSFSAQLMLARIFVDGREWTQASEYAASASRLNPKSLEAQSILNRSRIELLSGQPQSRQRVDQMVAELIANDDSLQNRLLAFRIALSRQEWDQADKALEQLRQRFGQTVQSRIAEAEYLLRRNMKDQAAEVLDEAIQAYPKASEPVILRAALLTEQDNILQALVLLQEAESRMDGQDQRKVQLWMGDLYRRTGQIEDAVKLFTRLADGNPQDILARRQLLALGRDERSIEQLQQWIDQIKAIEGDAGRLWKIEQASLWMARGDFQNRYSQIVSLMNENLTANPDDKQSLMILAGAHEQAGNKQLAVSLFRNAMTRHPEDIDLAIAAMGAMYRAEEYRDAEQLLADLLAAGHTDPRLAELELQSSFRHGQLDTAENLLEKMVASNAGNSSAKLSLALLKTRNGQFDQAKTLIDELLAENPDQVTSYAALVDWYMRQNQQDKAVAVCNDYLASHDTVDAYRLRCQLMLVTGQTEKAVEDIEQIIQRAQDNPTIWLNVSELYTTARMRDKALEAAKKAITLDPESFEAQKQTAILLMGDPETQSEGMALLEKALAQQPRDMQLRLQKALRLLAQGSENAKQAITMFNELVNEYPRLEPAWSTLTEWYLMNSQAGMAMDTVLRGLAAIPDSRVLLVLKSRVEAVRSPSVALETLNQLARRFPTDAAIMEMRVRMLQRLDKTGEALTLLREWIGANESAMIPGVNLLLMDLLYQTGSVKEAQQVYEQLRTQPQVALNAMVQWIRLIGKTAPADQITAVFRSWYDANPQQDGQAALPILENLLTTQRPEAAKAAERILALVQSRHPDDPSAAYGMAMLRHMTGQKKEAVPLYERALQLQPDNVIAMNNLAWILSQELGDHKKALALTEKGLAQAPDYADLLDTQGNIYVSLGEYQKAADDFRMAADRYLDNQSQKTASLFSLGKCLRQLGKNEQAKIEFYKARDLDEQIGGLSPAQKVELSEMLQ